MSSRISSFPSSPSEFFILVPLRYNFFFPFYFAFQSNVCRWEQEWLSQKRHVRTPSDDATVIEENRDVLTHHYSGFFFFYRLAISHLIWIQLHLMLLGAPVARHRKRWKLKIFLFLFPLWSSHVSIRPMNLWATLLPSLYFDARAKHKRGWQLEGRNELVPSGSVLVFTSFSPFSGR